MAAERYYPEVEILRHFRPEPLDGRWVLRWVQRGILVGTHDGGPPSLFDTRDLALDSAAKGLRQLRAAENHIGMLDD